jgi:hypothetical protein
MLREKDSLMTSLVSRLFKNKKEIMLKHKKTKCMTNYKPSTASYSIKGRKRRMIYTTWRFRAIKTQEISNWERKEEDVDKRKRSNLIKNRTTSIDSEVKWKPKSKCRWKRENKSVTISKRCWSKTKPTRRDKRMMRKGKDWKILRLKMNTQECLINKRMTEEKKWRIEKLELKNSWTKWLITYSTRWIKSSSGRTRWLPDTKKKENPTKETWNKSDSIESRMTRKKWEISWISKWLKKDREKQMRRLILIYKLKCGTRIRKIMTRKKEGWKNVSNLSIRTMPPTSCNRLLLRTPTSKEWTALNSHSTSPFWERPTTSWRPFPSMRVVNKTGKTELTLKIDTLSDSWVNQKWIKRRLDWL